MNKSKKSKRGRRKDKNMRPRGVGAQVTVKAGAGDGRKTKAVHWNAKTGELKWELEDGVMLEL